MEFQRRQFLKLGLAASAGVAATGVLGAAGYAALGRHVSRTTSNFHDYVDTVCRMCPAGCGIRGFVDSYGRLVTLAGIPDHPVNYGKICAKGMAAINLHYHPERILTPLVVKNDRAMGFAQSEYKAAIKKAADQIRNAKAKNAFFVVDTQDDDPEPYGAVFRALGVEHRVISRPILKQEAKWATNNKVFGKPEVQPDLKDARLILAFGANPFEGGDYFIALAKAIADARVENHAQLMVFDPRNTNTAGRADRWLPIKPGTDYVAALYLYKLVAKDTDPALNDVLADLDEVTACKITGLTPDDFAAVAKAIRKAGNVSIIVGNGIYQGPDPVQTRAAINMLEKAAGGAQFVAKAGNPDPLGIAAPNEEIDRIFKQVTSGKRPVFYLNRRSNPVYSGGGEPLKLALRNHDKIVGHVSICSFINETNRFADVLIPERLPLEDWGIVPALWMAKKQTWTYQQPVVEPPAKIQSGFDVFMDIAKELGFQGLVDGLGKSHKDRVAERLSRMNYVKTGKDFPNVLYIPASDNEVMDSDAASIEVKFSAVDTIARFDKRRQSRSDFTLVLHDSNVMNDQFAKCKWNSEIAHRNPLKIHSDDAAKLGIRQGDAVLVSASKNSITASATLCQSVRPGTVSLSIGFGHDYNGKVARGEHWRTDRDPDAWLIWWGSGGNGVNAQKLAEKGTVKVRVTKA